MKILNKSKIQELYNIVREWKKEKSIYFGIDVWKNVLDVWISLSDPDVQYYLWTIDNTATGFKQIEGIIINLILYWVNENDIYFCTENTWIYGHDIMNYFDDRIPNTYILNSNLTCNARKYYAKWNSKNDEIDAIIIALTLKDLDDKHKLESINNPFRKNCPLGFVRRSFSNERDSLRLLFRRLASLRALKSSLMTSINMSKERLFPELKWIFSIKHRASSESLLINNFSRWEILDMSKDEFIEKYRNVASKWQKSSLIISKVSEFYDNIHQRWKKESCSKTDQITWKYFDNFILEEIKFKLQHYELTVNEMESITKKISWILNILEKEWYFIPKFTWINDIEIWLIISELWFDIYQMNSREFIGFVWRYPENFTSWWWHIVKASKMSNKKWIIKKFIYIRMYGFQLHNPSFRLYKKLLMLFYWVNKETKNLVNLKNKRKVEIKCGEKLLKIIHNCYKNKQSYSEDKFLITTVSPLINNLLLNGLSKEKINQTIQDTYKNKSIPSSLKDILVTR